MQHVIYERENNYYGAKYLHKILFISDGTFLPPFCICLRTFHDQGKAFCIKMKGEKREICLLFELGVLHAFQLVIITNNLQ